MKIYDDIQSALSAIHGIKQKIYGENMDLNLIKELDFIKYDLRYIKNNICDSIDFDIEDQIYLQYGIDYDKYLRDRVGGSYFNELREKLYLKLMDDIDEYVKKKEGLEKQSEVSPILYHLIDQLQKDDLDNYGKI